MTTQQLLAIAGTVALHLMAGTVLPTLIRSTPAAAHAEPHPPLQVRVMNAPVSLMHAGPAPDSQRVAAQPRPQTAQAQLARTVAQARRAETPADTLMSAAPTMPGAVTAAGDAASEVAAADPAGSASRPSPPGEGRLATPPAPRIDASWAGNLPPAYPPAARRLGEQGAVHLDVHVGADGTVLALQLRRSSGSARLDRSAMEALRRWRFIPAQHNGQPMAAWYHDWQWIFKLEG